MLDSDKRTECVRVCMSERMFVDMNRRAVDADRTLAEFIYLLARNWTYGNGNPVPGSSEGPERANDGQ